MGMAKERLALLTNVPKIKNWKRALEMKRSLEKSRILPKPVVQRNP